MSTRHDLAADARAERIALADTLVERPMVDDFEPDDFDDHRLAARYGVTGGHLPGLDARTDDDWMVF